MQCLTMLYQLHWKIKHQIWPLWHIISVLSVVYTLFIWSHWRIFSVSTDWLIPKIISQCDIKPIMVSTIKTITSVLRTYITTSITDHPIRLAVYCDTSDNVRLSLHNCHYFIYIMEESIYWWRKTEYLEKITDSLQRKLITLL